MPRGDEGRSAVKCFALRVLFTLVWPLALLCACAWLTCGRIVECWRNDLKREIGAAWRTLRMVWRVRP